MPSRVQSVIAIALVSMLPMSQTTWAATKTATFTVMAVVISDCDIRSAPNMNFGDVGAAAQPVDAITTLGIICTPGTPYTISLSAGDAGGSTIENRRMANGAETLQYQLYRDELFTQVWGETVGTDTAGATGTGVEQQMVVYGRVPVQTLPAPGTYQSLVTVTMSY